MTSATGRLITALCLLLLTAIACAAEPGVGSAAPDFSLPMMGGGTYTLSDNWGPSGSVVILDFWATWCGPCKEAIPSLKQISTDYASRGVQVVGVAIDDPSNTAYNYATLTGINYTICGDPNFVQTAAYNSGSIPQLYVVDATGIVRYVENGWEGNHDHLRAALDRLVVPEPSSVVTLLIGVIGVGGVAFRRTRA